MNIRIVTSELKTTASQDLEINKDLLCPDQPLEDTIKAYEQNQEEKEQE